MSGDTLAEKDCSTCNTRRIRCDRTLPSCHKCRKKDLICPGYTKQLRWVNAAPGRSRSRHRINLVSDQSATTSDTDVALDGSTIPESRPVCKYKEILIEYVNKIAPKMVWLDWDDNPYRRLLLPLTQQSECLSRCIATICSNVGLSEANAPSAEERNRQAVSMVTVTMRDLMPAATVMIANEPERISGLIAILASALILSNDCLLYNDFEAARLQRIAARTIIQTIASGPGVRDDLFIFLREQVAIYDIIACTTLSDYDHVRDAVTFTRTKSDVMFGEYLNLVHELTISSLQSSAFPSPWTFMDIADRFEEARASSLLACKLLSVGKSDHVRLDLILLVDLYHHAGLLYACRSLDMNISEHVVDYHVHRLFHILKRMLQGTVLRHNMPWPVFVASLYVRNTDDLDFISNLCKELSGDLGSKHHLQLGTFANELYNRRCNDTTFDWKILAKEWELDGRPLVAI